MDKRQIFRGLMKQTQGKSFLSPVCGEIPRINPNGDTHDLAQWKSKLTQPQ